MTGQIASRRRFIAILGASAAMTVLACQQAQPSASTPSQTTSAPATAAPTSAPTSAQTPATPAAQATAAGASASPAPQATAAVASASPASQAKGTIDVWNFPLTTDDANQLWKPLVEKFNKQDPQITVKAEVLPWGGRKEKMITAYAAGTPPDVAYVNSEDLSLFGANDALRELDSLIPKETWADFQEAVSGNGISWKGKRIMVPTLLEIDGRLVNADMLSELGGDPTKPPFTWTDLLAFGAKAKDKGFFLTSWSLLSWDAEWCPTVWQAGGTVLNDDSTKVLLDQPPAADALTFVVELFQKGFVPKEGAVASDQEAAAASSVDYFMTNKQLVSGPGSADIINTVKKQAPKMNYVILPPFKNKEQVTFTDAGAFGIFNRSKNVDASTQWINFLIEPENQGFYCTLSGYLPPRKGATAFWKADDQQKKFIEAQASFTRMNQDMSYFFQEGKTTSAPHFQAAVLGKATVKQALADATRELQKTVDAFWAKQK